MTAKKKRYPLPKRFNVALSDQAYANLRALNAKWGLGNNYLLEILLIHLDQVTDPSQLDDVFERWIEEWGAPNKP